MTLASVCRRLLRILGIVAGVGLIVIICAVTALWLEHRASITLPTPSGRFVVGRVVSDWRDPTTIDSSSPIAGTKRELLAWIWYPTATASSAAAEPYSPTQLTPKQPLPSVPLPLRVWAWFTRDWSSVHGHSVGGYGHSFGGAVVAQFCHDDPRCKSGLDIDGAPLGNVIQSGINRPFLFLLSDHSHDVGPEVDRIKADIQSIYDHLPANARYRVEIR